MSVSSTTSTTSTCTANNHRFINETLRSVTSVFEEEESDEMVQGRSLSDREVQEWLSQKLSRDEALKTFNIYKGIEPRPLGWDRVAKLRPQIPSSFRLAPTGGVSRPKKVRWQDKPLQSGNKKFFLKSYLFIETPKGKVVAWSSNEWITKNQFCDQPWVEEHKKRYIHGDGDLFIYRPYKPKKPDSQTTSQGKLIPNGYFIHLIGYQKPALKNPGIEVQNSPTRTKGFLQYLTELIRYLFHKVVVFPKKMIRKIFHMKAQLPKPQVIEDHKKKWMQKDGELLIYRPDKYSVHLLNPETTKKITFTRQDNQEQEGFLAI